MSVPLNRTNCGAALATLAQPVGACASEDVSQIESAPALPCKASGDWIGRYRSGQAPAKHCAPAEQASLQMRSA